MKQVFSIFFCFLILLFSGCSKQEQASASSIDNLVSAEIENIENIETYNDETIKALSVVIRTKIKKENTQPSGSFESKNARIYNIVKETSNETVNNGENLQNIDYILNENTEWIKEIKKSDILNFLAQKNISLSNISDASPIYNKEGYLDHILIGGKKISYDELSTNFNLKSNNIKNIKNNKTSLTIYGQGSDSKLFNISKANNLAKDGKTYKEILKEFY